MTDYNNLLKQAIIAALHAGEEILGVYNIAPEVELKDDKSPLTLADRKAHNKIMELLAGTGLPVLSEEGKTIPYGERKNWKRFWMVDPLDGTKEFIKKNGEFTVNIALIENNQPVMGVIYVPVSDTLFLGATWLPSRMKQHAFESLREAETPEEYYDRLLASSLHLPVIQTERAHTVVASRSHLTPETEIYISSLKEKFGELAFISKGSSLKICLVAEGVADVYPRLAPTMEWDTAAGHAIAENAGCIVINHHTGQPVTYNKPNLLNPHFVVMRP
jgi:3'(2'), 5'-bisphosphate nucleotidase